MIELESISKLATSTLKSSFSPLPVTFYSNNNPMRQVREVSAGTHFTNEETGTHSSDVSLRNKSVPGRTMVCTQIFWPQIWALPTTPHFLLRVSHRRCQKSRGAVLTRSLTYCIILSDVFFLMACFLIHKIRVLDWITLRFPISWQSRY